MPKPTFKMALRDGTFVEAKYTPIIFTANTTTHKLALHRRDRTSEWLVSDPKTGAKICTVRAEHKGIPCSSRGISERLARQFAVADLEVLVSRIGSDRFNATMANPKLF